VSAINDGGAAFPTELQVRCNGEVIDTENMTGMTLRDWFAGMALQGRLHRLGNPHDAREILAQVCYDIADAMLKAREVKPEAETDQSTKESDNDTQSELAASELLKEWLSTAPSTKPRRCCHD
jgi:hypothetical protein